QEIVPEISCAAVPITNGYGSVVAAMSVGMPAYRFPKDRHSLLSSMKQAAVEISAHIAAAEAQRAAATPEVAVPLY
ncbi:MAG: Bacterial transcriptional regulator, partial [Solirubrobacterales bacterium]|nr:Bacterial transcriptional regulator [Solirubrobacterales bacterium]